MFFATISFGFVKFLFMAFLALFATVHACGTLPQGEVTAIRFNVSGFLLAAEMAYSETLDVQARIPSLSKTKEAAKQFVQNLVINAVNDVLQEQGRQAFLLDAVISLILQQLNITTEYTPLECKTATDSPTNQPNMPADVDGCFVIDGMVPSLCADKNNCNFMTGTMLKSIPTQHHSFTGILRTTNVILATWSRQMWQSVLNRVYRRLTSERFEKYFSRAIITVNN